LENVKKALADVRELAASGDAAKLLDAKKQVAAALQAATAVGVPQEDILAASQARAAPAQEEAAGAAAEGEKKEGKAEGESSSSSSDSYSEVEEEPLDKGTLDKANLEGAAAAMAFASLLVQPPPPPPPPQ